MSRPTFEWRQIGNGYFAYGYSGGDGEFLPESDIVRGNSGSWIPLGKVVQDGAFGFYCYAIGTKHPRGQLPGPRSPTAEKAKKRVERRVVRWVEKLIAAWSRRRID